MHHAFICYAVPDRETAQTVCASLERAGILCWMASRDLTPGREKAEQTLEAIYQSSVAILIFSSNANSSPDVKRELQLVLERGLIVVPFRIENVPLSKSLEYFISVPHWQDAFVPPLQPHLERLAYNVATILNTHTPAAVSPHRKRRPFSFKRFLRWVIAVLLIALLSAAGVAFIYRTEFPDIKFQQSDFVSVTLDDHGEIKARFHGKSTSFYEQLGDGVSLEMVKLPADDFWMGSTSVDLGRICSEYRKAGLGQSVCEQAKSEMPQGKVNVVAFYMSRYEITQAQWRVMAEERPVRIELPATPALFRGDDRPVEQVSWEEAVEFCQRLSRETDHAYRLPSEGEWEYACRASTTTSFYTGDTITAEVANFNASLPWGQVSKQEDRKHTIDVGAIGFPNAFGLFDMEGNVSEWCKDAWHPDYREAPSGAKVWDGGDTRYRVVRGGSYHSPAAFCRSAYRAYSPVETRNGEIGFRVALFASEVK